MNETTRHKGGWDSEGNRRVAVVYIGEDIVLDRVLFSIANIPRVVMVAKNVNVPSDAEVIRVSHSWERRCFGFLLRHDSFAPVSEGEMPPTIDTTTEWEVVDTRPDEPTPTVVGG